MAVPALRLYSGDRWPFRWARKNEQAEQAVSTLFSGRIFRFASRL